jgi:glycerophosphoryl diester phosphodiesterase
MLILAHRGAHEPETPGVRENTVDAFRAALDVGAAGVELDVRRSADGVLVVHHDAALPGGGPVGDTPAAALPGWMPTLDAALAVLDAATLVNLEVKNSPLEPDFDATHAVAAQLAPVADRHPARYLVSSFNLATLDAFRVASRAPTGWLTVPGFDQIAALHSVVDGGHNALNPHHSAITAELVAAAHAAGVQVVAWTVDDPADIERLAGFGVDVLITDRPALAVATVSPQTP